jgi:hypothetical protein
MPSLLIVDPECGIGNTQYIGFVDCYLDLLSTYELCRI